MNAHQRRKLRRLECREGRGQATMRTEDGRVVTLEQYEIKQSVDRAVEEKIAELPPEMNKATRMPNIAPGRRYNPKSELTHIIARILEGF